ncbi:DUF2293 domain-containing protein [Desulfogranum mediterraneum]|uniref:DUF2293 domain-containing protein n=1 Tax=Desulfogranum mediterraneum TaxID=160661 RepID=UPI00129474B9
MSSRIVSPGPKIGTLFGEDGELLVPPEGWEFLPAGDGPLTRRVKQLGPCWQVQVQKGRRTISRGIWAPAAHIRTAREALEAKRATPEHRRRKATDQARRERQHQAYVREFYQACLEFLAFAPAYEQQARLLAQAVTSLATPVGSGTVARTSRIPLEERVRAAVIAWLRHQTTGYDQMVIPRVKGRRREVRRLLARRSVELLARYRAGEALTPSCPLRLALEKARAQPGAPLSSV